MRLFDGALDAVACLLVLLLLVVVTLGVVTRGLDDPLIWTDEGARFLMVWTACLGWMLASRRRQHVRIRFFQELLPRPARRASEIAIQLGMLTLGAVVAWKGIDLVQRNHDLDATSLPLSMAWMYVPLVPAGLLTAAQAAFEIGMHVRDGGTA